LSSQNTLTEYRIQYKHRRAGAAISDTDPAQSVYSSECIQSRVAFN